MSSQGKTRKGRGKDAFCVFFGSAFGLGLFPVAPGSFGALAGVVVHVGVVLLAPRYLQQSLLVASFLVVCLIHFLLTPWAQQYWKDSDPKNFVLDEVAGYLLVPILFPGHTLWKVALLGFFLFRILDIIKFPPAHQIDRDMHGAWGILLDDLVSSVYAAGCLYLLLRFTNVFAN